MHPHNHRAEDIALGFILGKAVSNSGGQPSAGPGGYGWMAIPIIAAILVGLGDLALVPVMWQGSLALMDDSGVLGTVSLLMTGILAGFPPFVIYGLISSAVQDRKFEAEWKRRREENHREIMAFCEASEQRRIAKLKEAESHAESSSSPD